MTETVDGTVVNTMTYDNYGNILTKNGKTYTYGNAAWKDLLTAYDGQTITYDAQGNPTNYLGHTLTWEKGRQLKSFDSNTYTYNAKGIRTSKTVNGVKHSYVLDGSKILRETFGNAVLTPIYDTEDAVCGIVFNNQPFFFVRNLQGDVIGIVNRTGAIVAQYSYDAWGAGTILTDTSGINIATVNPFRYRGYYFDTETNLYYLQSRYYDPLTGRFISADSAKFLGIGNTITSYNLFSYCENEPLQYVDKFGLGPWTSWLSLSDYRTIHNKVADLVCWSLGIWRASREVYVKGSKGYGFLDVYDTVSCEYYEVKSGGAAYTSRTDKQMKKYDVAKPLFSSKEIKRGKKKVSGSFYYGAWKVTYKLEKNGLVVYRPVWKQSRFMMGVFTVFAITLISITVFFTGGATAPAYALLLV